MTEWTPGHRPQEIVNDLIERAQHTRVTRRWAPPAERVYEHRLPPASAPTVDPMTVLTLRQATRFYRPDGIGQAIMAGVLQAPSAARAALSTAETVPYVQILAAAYRVEGLRPGLYDVDPTGTQATFLLDLPPGRQWLLQDEFAAAPLVSIITCDLPAVAAAGAHAHRLVMNQAGVAAHSMWLAAGGRGLAGSIFGGLIPWGVPLPGFQPGGTRSPLLAFACGFPMSDPAVSPWGTAGGWTGES
ncbi:hypothetical protein DP939_06355 [Spongiactinospora rosea]|uniref:Nitroreductase domain-containing protein n=1 Tax=Spongiactinospora rosea TaxID=2248750 RepID=A0A366M3C6_9ACTN|nr:hypothetical protein [Spongiactinospora rosea]RBQ20701.1 hypothetical protein DP939_06355 [Spongiactinospora rosea]